MVVVAGQAFGFSLKSRFMPQRDRDTARRREKVAQQRVLRIACIRK